MDAPPAKRAREDDQITPPSVSGADLATLAALSSGAQGLLGQVEELQRTATCSAALVAPAFGQAASGLEMRGLALQAELEKLKRKLNPEAHFEDEEPTPDLEAINPFVACLGVADDGAGDQAVFATQAMSSSNGFPPALPSLGACSSIAEPTTAAAKPPFGGARTLSELLAAKPYTHPSNAHCRTGLFQDLIWTPAIEAILERDRKKDEAMIRALYNCIEANYHGQACHPSQLGSDFTVSALKKEAMFKTAKLLDVIKRYDDIFELIGDATGSKLVRLKDGVREFLGPAGDTAPLLAAVPSSTTTTSGAVPGMAPPTFPRPDQQLFGACPADLPARIPDPVNAAEGMQALRIELLHAIARRGGHSQVQELGQEPKVQLLKKGLSQGRKLADFIRLFPQNFALDADAPNGGATVDLVSTDVSNQDVIYTYAMRNQPRQPGMRNAGRGKGSRPAGVGGLQQAISAAQSGNFAPAGGAGPIGLANAFATEAAVQAAQAQAKAALENLAQTMASAGIQLPTMAAPI